VPPCKTRAGSNPTPRPYRAGTGLAEKRIVCRVKPPPPGRARLAVIRFPIPASRPPWTALSGWPASAPMWRTARRKRDAVTPGLATVARPPNHRARERQQGHGKRLDGGWLKTTDTAPGPPCRTARSRCRPLPLTGTVKNELRHFATLIATLEPLRTPCPKKRHNRPFTRENDGFVKRGETF